MFMGGEVPQQKQKRWGSRRKGDAKVTLGDAGGRKLELYGINSWNNNSNSRPGQRGGTHGRGSRRSQWSLACHQRWREGDPTVNPMPDLAVMFHLIRLQCPEKGLFRCGPGEMALQPCP
ncbi:hypothetical protein GCM10017674_78980 [Streptomyces gardneri]|uniref:Uncharacterized protein n=1 Tax=Streptomyces gardneri TaxID=66892 RepID=A0A4Y3RXZ5_9ACTN|nr:hypothetical protein SGA01_75730 [Streptomyces gardneri]GHH22846.1 hypothetical protein GCM10017674_78980 [Streptomyces gardneri]